MVGPGFGFILILAQILRLFFLASTGLFRGSSDIETFFVAAGRAVRLVRSVLRESAASLKKGIDQSDYGCFNLFRASWGALRLCLGSGFRWFASGSFQFPSASMRKTGRAAGVASGRSDLIFSWPGSRPRFFRLLRGETFPERIEGGLYGLGPWPVAFVQSWRPSRCKIRGGNPSGAWGKYV